MKDQRTHNSILVKNPITVWFMRNWATLTGLLIVCVFMISRTDAFLKTSNIMTVLRQISTNAIAAFAMTFTLLVVGVDLSIEANMALSGCICVALMFNGWPLWASIIVALAVGIVFGVITGSLIAFIKMPPFIASLAIQQSMRGLCHGITNGKPLVFNDDFLYYLGNGRVGVIPIPVIIMLAIMLIASVVINKTLFGRRMYAVGSNKDASRFAGINVNGMIVKVYMISALLSGISGIILCGRLASSQPTAAEGTVGNAIAAAVLGGVSFNGGVGKISGALLGALIIGALNNGMNLQGITYYWQDIMKGIIIILAITLDSARRMGWFGKIGKEVKERFSTKRA